MSCCDGNQGRDCPARAARGGPACAHRLDPHADVWELVESAALILFAVVAVCGIAGFVYGLYGADLELALWRVADAAWALSGGAS